MRTRSRDEAQLRADELGLEDIEAASQIKHIRRDVLTKMVLSERITVTEAIERFGEYSTPRMTPAAVQMFMANLVAWSNMMRLADKHVQDIPVNDIDGWINSDDGRKASTRRKTLSVVRQFYKFLIHQGLACEDQTEGIRVKMEKLSMDQKESHKHGPFTDEEYMRIMQHLHQKLLLSVRRAEQFLYYKSKAEADGCSTLAFNDRLREVREEIDHDQMWIDMLEIGWESGLRFGDVFQLETKSFTMNHCYVTVWTDKTDARVQVKIPDALHKRIVESRCQNGKFLFMTKPGELTESKRTSMSRTFRFLRRKLKIDHGSFHSLRYSYLRRMKEAGVPLFQIQQDVGHASEKMTERYATP
jgi:integrase